MEPLWGGDPAAPRRVLPCDPWGVPAPPIAGQSHPARGADAIRRGHVSAELLDAAGRPARRDHPRAGPAAYQGSDRGGRSSMRGTVLCAALAALGAACQRVENTPRASETPAAADTTTAAAPTPAPVPVPAAAPPPPPSPAATKLAVVEGFLTPASVLH